MIGYSMKRDIGDLAGALIFFGAVAIIWWLRYLGMKEGRLNIGNSPGFNRAEHPKIFNMISWFHVLMAVALAGLGLFGVIRYALGE